MGGAGAGALIGNAVGRPGAGAAIGGVLGLGAGALVGDQLQGHENTNQQQQQQHPMEPGRSGASPARAAAHETTTRILEIDC